MNNSHKKENSQLLNENNFDYDALLIKIKNIVNDYNEISSMFQKDKLNALGGINNPESSFFKNSEGNYFKI